MRGLLIDSKNKTVTEVTITKDQNGSKLKSIYGHLNCDMFEVVNIGNNDIYVDEEGLLKLNEKSTFFKYGKNSQPIAGNGLIVGYDDKTGESIETKLTIEEVKGMVNFLSYEQVSEVINEW